MYYLALTAPLAWLAWLALRPFLVEMHRLLFFFVGIPLYGFFVKAFVIPLNDAAYAHLVALQELGRMTGSPAAPVSNEVVRTLVCYPGVTFAVVCLLMLWAQRALAHGPTADSNHSG